MDSFPSPRKFQKSDSKIYLSKIVSFILRRPYTPRITFASNPEKLSCWRLTTYSRKRWRGAYGTAAARNVKFIITELRDRFIGINGFPSKRRSTSARRVGAYYDARSSEWFG